ncbi:uncharacterized protein LOC135843399 [Planococcus citri]|uniref:uncharacterized protein LOC135843399 n=1 Tax=Planococcus citri TaxID=170843 RepID=UPI0031F807C2
MTDVEASDKQEEVSDSRAEDDLPQKILEKYNSDLRVQIIKGYRILQVIAYHLKDSSFFEKPANEKLAGKEYYDVIKNPMWFDEIKRKIFDVEYNSLVEIVKDMRLVFENCYYFWGPKTLMSEQCVKMERLMEKQLLMLPRDLRILCSLEETHGKNTDKIVTKIWNRYRNKGKGCSNLMLRTWRKRRISEDEDYRIKSDLANYCSNKKQILKWEREVLGLEDNSNTTFDVVQLPQIGQFFHLIGDTLAREAYCQIEIERMFLIPKYSNSFKEILSLLLLEENSEESPSYDDLMTKLKDLLIEWYMIYEDNNHDDDEASRVVGIEPEFFRILGETNPLLNSSYEDLSYRQKVVTVKSLCDHFVYERSNIKEAIANADEKIFTSETIGRDKFGYGYLFFNTFLDFRLYKQKLIEDDVSSNNKFYDDFSNETLKKFFPKGCTNFEMVADSVEGLRCLIDELIYSDAEPSKKDGKSTNYEVIESLRDLENRIIENENLYIERTNRARMKLYDEWRSHNSDWHDDPSDVEDASNECQENGESEQTHASEADDSICDSPVSKSTLGKSVDNTDEDETRFSSNTTDEVKDDQRIDGNDEQLTNETDADGLFIKTEIKDEPLNDELSSSETSTYSGRRRRSSVPSYNMFDNKIFSDESDSESAEEIYSEGDDSDDDWDAPKKKSRKLPKNKLVKQLKQNAEDSNRRKRKYRRRNEPESVAAEPETTGPKPAIMEIDPTTIKKEEELDIMDSATATTTTSQENYAMKEEDKSKPEQKIKVVSLARLQNNSENISKSRECAPLPRIVSQGSLQMPSQGTPLLNNSIVSSSAPPNAGNTYSGVHPATFAIVGQPQVISNAYIITTNQNSFQGGSAPQYQMQPYPPSAYRAQGITAANAAAMRNHQVPRIVNATGAFINAQASNNKLLVVNQNMPIRFTPSMQQQQQQQQQVSRTPLNFYNKSARFRPSQPPSTTPPTFNRQMSHSMPPKNNTNYGRNTLSSKLGRNVTVIPKVINKINERGNSFKEIEGAIGIHSDNGTLQYVVNLANGTHVPLTNDQVQKLRDGNNGALPLKLKIPVPMDVAEKIEPCVVIDD